MEFGRYAVKNARKQGKKPATFNFLGFVHECARSRQGKFTVHVKTMAKWLGRGLKAVWEWCKQHRHDAVNEQQKTLNAKLRGHYQYYGRRTNYRAIRQFYQRVRRIWREWLSRRTRGTLLTWERFAAILRQYRCCYLGSPMPGRAQGVTPEEPTAGNLHGGVRDGRELLGHGRPTRARSWKRRTGPRKTYSPGSSLSEAGENDTHAF
jgi:hypothetical protein